MKKQVFMLILMAAWLVILTACSTSTAVVQLNTPAPNPPTAAPSGQVDVPGGQIDVPGLKLQLYVPSANPMLGTPDAHGRPASFWMGIWHGIISPFTLAASFLGRDNVQIYEVHNDGRLYNLGFFFGVLIMPAVLGIFFGIGR
jgi:hypothetical protein